MAQKPKNYNNFDKRKVQRFNEILLQIYQNNILPEKYHFFINWKAIQFSMKS